MKLPQEEYSGIFLKIRKNKMKFSVGTNFQDDFIAKIKKDSVAELYGKLTSDFIGGGRPSYLLSNITKDKVKKHVEDAHKHGLKFNYLLNAFCLDNKEYTVSGQKRLRQLLDWLIDIKVDRVTVAIPYLMQFIKNQYPQLKVGASILANIDSVEAAKFWCNLGLDRLALSVFVIRDFKLLKAIRKAVSCQLVLIAQAL